MPGYISHKGFFADDGERVTIVEFEHEEGMRAWRTNPEHRAAQKLARTKYYTEYHVQVCTARPRVEIQGQGHSGNARLIRPQAAPQTRFSDRFSRGRLPADSGACPACRRCR